MNWLQSFSGKGVTPLNLRPEQVTFADIPHALSQKVRFNGHLSVLGYSVAQHCALGAELIGGPALKGSGHYTKEQLELKLAFLLHEVSEVYLPDVPAPIKPTLSVQYVSDLSIAGAGICVKKSWVELEDQHAEVMFEALGLTHLVGLLHSPVVKQMDRAMLITEKRDLRGPDAQEVIVQEKERYGGEPVPNFKITRVWGAIEAKHEFTMLYEHLRKELGL